AALAAAFDRREPAVLIDGPPGTGKSLVARRWLERLPPDVPRVLLPNAHADRPAELLQAILFDLDRLYQGLTEQELRLAVTAAVLDAAAVGLLTGACGGLPRVLNQAAGLAAELAESGGAGTIDVEAALEALSRLGLAAESDETAGPALIPHPTRPEEPAPAAR